MPSLLDDSALYGRERRRAAVEELGVLREELGIMSGKAKGTQIPFMPWNMKVPMSDGRDLDFRTFPFQEEWYSDEIVYKRFVEWMKGTQVGVSEYAVRWALFFPDTRGDKSLYVFPVRRQLLDFSDERVKPLVESEYLSTRIPRKSVDNKMLKKVGLGSIYFRGSKNARDLDSIPADELILDEYDDLEQGNIPRAEKRLSGVNSRGLIRRLGVPRYSDLGIHERYELSDKRKWFVKCESCSKELPISFYSDEDRSVHYVDVERGCIVCANCETPLKQDWVANGRWVAEHPDREIVGYHVHKLMVPTVNVADVIVESLRTKPFEVQEFWNSTLGLPYDFEEGRLSKQAIAAAISAGGNFRQGPWDSGYAGRAVVTMGVDVASVRDLNVKISEHLDESTKRTLWVGQVESFDQLAIMMDAFQVTLACIDHNPDGRLSRAFANRFPGRVFVLSWGDNAGELLSFDAEQSTVHVRRTETIAAMLDMIRRQRNYLPANLPENYVSHLRSAVLKQTEDDKGRVVVYYQKSGDDDYMQCESYDLVATELWWALRLTGQAQRETFNTLDELMEFKRSRVADYEVGDYTPGPDEEDGPEDGDLYNIPGIWE